MVTRLSASFLALVVLATSGALGGAVYLCSMDGQVRSECCCTNHRSEADDNCAGVVQAEACCEIRVAESKQQPTRVEANQDIFVSMPTQAALPAVAMVRPPRVEDVDPPSSARGPPPGGQPPLFIWNCSYLI